MKLSDRFKAAPVIEEWPDYEVVNNRFDFLRQYHLEGIERDLAAGKNIQSYELATAIKALGPYPISLPVRMHICDRLMGKVKPPRGRRAIPNVLVQDRGLKIKMFYRHYFGLLQNTDKKPCEMEELVNYRGPDILQGPPHEMAARIVASMVWFRHLSWQRIKNIVSSQN